MNKDKPMNLVECKIFQEPLSPQGYKGSIWNSHEGSNYYIFSQVAEDNFCLISLFDGNRLNNPAENFGTIINGAILVAMRTKITFE